MKGVALNREQMALAILQYDLANGYLLRQVDDDAWLVRHAGGFSPISQHEEGVYEVMPERVAAVGEHLSDAGFTAFVEAIRLWQKSTLVDYLFHLAPDLIVGKFCQTHVEEGRTLLAVAAHHGIDPVVFFGADHHDW